MENKLIKTWLQIAQRNPWICQRGSENPEDDCVFESPVLEKDFHECKDLDDFVAEVKQGNWQLGQVFYLKYTDHQFCFINQVNGGDEWLTIRGNVEFESCSFLKMSEKYIHTLFKKWSEATKEQLLKLEF